MEKINAKDEKIIIDKAIGYGDREFNLKFNSMQLMKSMKCDTKNILLNLLNYIMKKCHKNASNIRSLMKQVQITENDEYFIKISEQINDYMNGNHSEMIKNLSNEIDGFAAFIDFSRITMNPDSIGENDRNLKKEIDEKLNEIVSSMKAYCETKIVPRNDGEEIDQNQKLPQIIGTLNNIVEDVNEIQISSNDELNVTFKLNEGSTSVSKLPSTKKLITELQSLENEWQQELNSFNEFL